MSKAAVKLWFPHLLSFLLDVALCFHFGTVRYARSLHVCPEDRSSLHHKLRNQTARFEVTQGREERQRYRQINMLRESVVRGCRSLILLYHQLEQTISCTFHRDGSRQTLRSGQNYGHEQLMVGV